LERWFDERFLSATAQDYRFGKLRIAVTLGVGLLLVLTANWRAALGWSACAALLETALQTLIRPIAEGEPLSPVRGAATVVLRVVLTYAWFSAGVILWSTGGATGQTLAMSFFSVLLLYLIARREGSVLLAVAALPALAVPLVTALLYPAAVLPQAVILLHSALMAGLAGFCLLRDCGETGAMRIASAAAPARAGSASTSPPGSNEELSLESLRRAKAEAEAASQAKSAFLAVMSHEIRTPLNGVLGMTQALAADPTLTQGQRARLQTIRQSGEALLAILNDILDLSKIEAGKLELESIEFDLEEIARDVHSSFKPLASQKGLEFKLTVESAAKGLCLGDPTRVRQILFNLVSNALKFTDEGEISLQVERADKRGVKIMVSDSGVGIDAAHLERIFGKFEQADASSTRRYGGTGLGLAICRDLCGLMGGSITAQSEPGRGTRFIITLALPQVAAAAGAPSRKSAADSAEEPDISGLRVLAAEDNPVNQLVLKALLAQVGIEPVIVENGKLAVEAWKTNDFDLILMDIQMPQMDGMEATQAIRSEEASSGLGRTPIIALTANAMAHQVAEYAGVGMDAHIPKPLDLRSLTATVDRLMSQARDGSGSCKSGKRDRTARRMTA
jgi:signal transduction histidine kinase/CheY-like chemotaxis protein